MGTASTLLWVTLNLQGFACQSMPTIYSFVDALGPPQATLFRETYAEMHWSSHVLVVAQDPVTGDCVAGLADE